MNKKDKLETLKSRIQELKPIVFKGFKTDEELDAYRETIQSERQEYYNLIEQLEQLKWELLSPEEKAEKVEQDKMYKLKREGKLFEYLANKNK